VISAAQWGAAAVMSSEGHQVPRQQLLRVGLVRSAAANVGPTSIKPVSDSSVYHTTV
jgi:hypothetical protein